MVVALGVAYLLAEILALLLVILALVRVGFARLASVIGIARDGFPPGNAAPAWSLLDLDGNLYATPTGDRWQILLFANRSLVAFPELVGGIERMMHVFQQVELLLITQEKRAEAQATAEGLELHVPIISVAPEFYARFRVRVMPFVFVLDPQGVVRWVGLINSDEQLFHAWRMAQANARAGNAASEGIR